MLDCLERQHGIEAPLFLQQIFRRRFAVIDGETGILGMAARHRDRPRVGIDSGDGKSQPGQRLGDDAAAASDIEQRQPGKRPDPARIAAEMRRQMIADEGKPRRVEPV